MAIVRVHTYLYMCIMLHTVSLICLGSVSVHVCMFALVIIAVAHR